MKQITILVLDGFMAWRRQTHNRKYMHDVILERLKGIAKTIVPWGNDRYTIFTDDHRIEFMSIRGGLLFKRFKKIKRFIAEYNRFPNDLILIGKSYGGNNIVRIHQDMYLDLKYDHVKLMLIDPCCVRKIIHPETQIQPRHSNFCYHYYQTNERRLNGMQLNAKYYNPGTWLSHNLSYGYIGCEKMNHFNIIEHNLIGSHFDVILKKAQDEEAT